MILDYCYALSDIWIHVIFSLICSLPSSSLSCHLVTRVGQYRRGVRSENTVPATQYLLEVAIEILPMS